MRLELGLVALVTMGACDPSVKRGPTETVKVTETPKRGEASETLTHGASQTPDVRADVGSNDRTSAEREAAPCPGAPEGMSCIPGGAFTRGIDDDPHVCDQVGQPSDGKSSSTPAAEVWVDTFFIDTTEVTVGAWKQCMAAGKCPEQGPRYADFSASRQPITGIDWFAARDFCTSLGKRLPTEAEWELAARGHDGELNPWGNEPPDCARAVVKDENGRSCGEKKRRGKKPETGRVLEVGSRPAGRFGVVDLSGNVEEWVADWWTPNWETCGEACLGDNPRGPCGGADECPGHEYRSVRGGSWYWPPEHATGYHRRRHQPANAPTFHHFGFRCARDVSPRN